MRQRGTDARRQRACQDPVAGIQAIQFGVNIPVALLQAHQVVRHPLVDIPQSKILHQFGSTPDDGVLEALEQHLVDVGLDRAGLDRQGLLDLSCHCLACPDEAEPGQSGAGEKAQQHEGEKKSSSKRQGKIDSERSTVMRRDGTNFALVNVRARDCAGNCT